MGSVTDLSRELRLRKEEEFVTAHRRAMARMTILAEEYHRRDGIPDEKLNELCDMVIDCVAVVTGLNKADPDNMTDDQLILAANLWYTVANVSVYCLDELGLSIDAAFGIIGASVFMREEYERTGIMPSIEDVIGRFTAKGGK